MPLDKLLTIEKDSRQFGFDWPNVDLIFEQIKSECKEIQEAIANKETPHRIQEEIGDLIHAAINLCVYLDYDVVDTLSKTTEKFDKRMKALKQISKEHGHNTLKNQPIEVLLRYWEKAKNA